MKKEKLNGTGTEEPDTAEKTEAAKNGKQKKKKKKGKYILLIILLLVLAAIAAASIYFFSLWRTAKELEKELDLAHFSYAVDVELTQEGLTQEQLAFIDSLARISGLEQNKFLRMHIEGSVWEDKVYAQVFLLGEDTPLAELYLSGGDDYINASLCYDAVRSAMVKKFALLDGLLPVVTKSSYMTMEQAERLTGEDLSVVRDFEPFFTRYHLAAPEYFAVFAVLPFIEHEKGSVLTLKEIKEPSQAKDKKISLYFEAEDPAQIVERNVAKYGDILSRLNINIDGSSFKALRRLAVTVSSEGVQEIVMPADVISREQMDTVEKIRGLFEEIGNLPSDSTQLILDMVNRLLGGYAGIQN